MASGGEFEESARLPVSAELVQSGQFLTPEERRQTFPAELVVDLTPAQYSYAGFYYRNHHGVVCFWCGVQIGDCSFDQNPWVLHAIYSPSCEFVQCHVGKDFVDTVHQFSVPPNTFQEVLQRMKEIGRDLQSLEFNEDVNQRQAMEMALSRRVPICKVYVAMSRLLQKGQRITEQNLLKELGRGSEGDDLAIRLVNGSSDTEGDVSLHPGQPLTCKKCDRQAVEIVTVPCRHVALCVSCAFRVSTCPDPRCRSPVSQRHRVYLY